MCFEFFLDSVSSGCAFIHYNHLTSTVGAKLTASTTSLVPAQCTIRLGFLSTIAFQAINSVRNNAHPMKKAQRVAFAGTYIEQRTNYKAFDQVTPQERCDGIGIAVAQISTKIFQRFLYNREFFPIAWGIHLRKIFWHTHEAQTYQLCAVFIMNRPFVKGTQV